MTIEKAIQLIKYIKYSINDDGPYERRAQVIALDMAIEAFQLQIAKKPIYSEYDDNGFDEIIPYKATCPTCGNEFEFGAWNDDENHHCVCGQKIDWK